MSGGAYVRGRAVIIPPPDDAPPDVQPFLIVEINIDCTICGEQKVMFAGHHLKALLEIFQEFIAAEPALTEAGSIQSVGTRTYRIPYDPEKNGSEQN